MRIDATKSFNEQLERAPKVIQEKYDRWITLVLELGILNTRKINSYRDHPLQGKRFGQRSISLNMKWRVIYQEVKQIKQIKLLEITPHKY